VIFLCELSPSAFSARKNTQEGYFFRRGRREAKSAEENIFSAWVGYWERLVEELRGRPACCEAGRVGNLPLNQGKVVQPLLAFENYEKK
jgi:hypothetical protein